MKRHVETTKPSHSRYHEESCWPKSFGIVFPTLCCRLCCSRLRQCNDTIHMAHYGTPPLRPQQPNYPPPRYLQLGVMPIRPPYSYWPPNPPPPQWVVPPPPKAYPVQIWWSDPVINVDDEEGSERQPPDEEAQPASDAMGSGRDVPMPSNSTPAEASRRDDQEPETIIIIVIIIGNRFPNCHTSDGI